MEDWRCNSTHSNLDTWCKWTASRTSCFTLCTNRKGILRGSQGRSGPPARSVWLPNLCSALTSRSAMARCMNMWLLPKRRARFLLSMLTRTVLLATADTAMRMLYVAMDMRWLSLNFMSSVRLSVIAVVTTTDSVVGVAMATTEQHQYHKTLAQFRPQDFRVPIPGC
jgi:hypothetical protein